MTNFAKAVEEYTQERESAGDASAGYLRELRSILASLSESFESLDVITHDSFKAHQLSMHRRVKWATVCRHTSAAKGLLEWAHKSGKLPTAPALWFPGKKSMDREATLRRPLRLEERDALLACLLVADAETWRWYVVAFWSAMRKSEVDSITLRWVDFEQETISIPARFSKSGTQDGPVDLHPMAAWGLAMQAETRGITDKDAPLFPCRDRRQHFWSAMRSAGIDQDGVVETHVARHTRLTQIADNGGLLAVMRQARHKHATTSEKYVHAGLEHARRANREAE